MAHPVLREDWTDYDNRKKKKEDRLFVSCEESWEVEYIVNKLKRHYPFTTEQSIRSAITSCCKSVPAPRPRIKFIECVTGKL